MAAPKRDNDLAARALVDALFFGDATACRNHKISLRTLQRYRQGLDEDPELTRAVAELTRVMETQNWLAQLEASMSLVLSKITQGLQEVKPGGLGDLERLVTILDSLAEIKLSRDMYGVDDQGEEATGAGAEGAARGQGQGAAARVTN